MPRAPASRQRSASSIGPSVRSSRQNGTSIPCDAAAHCKDAVVRHAVGGMPLGIVQRERERPLDPVRAHRVQELRGREREAVLVDAEVGVGVPDAQAVGLQRGDALELPAQELVEAGDGHARNATSASRGTC